MRDKFTYADNRDLVKWSVLLTLAERYSARHILQALYYRPTQWARLEVDGESVGIPASVTQHFGEPPRSSRFAGAVPVDVFRDEFVTERNTITLSSPESKPGGESGIVFLDPTLARVQKAISGSRA